MFNIYLGIYVILAILTIAGGTFKIYGMSQTLAAVLFFIGVLAIFIVYGIKWFGAAGSLFSKTPVSWPPMINTCPDYLVYYSRKMPDGSSQDSCIDMIGVSKNGALKKFPTSGDPPTDNTFYFSLVTKASDPAGKKQELCQNAISMGLTWEGITNGESCITPDGPVAPGSGGNGNGSCPQ